MIKDGNYITIQGWMVKDLQLKGNELLTYAIIYGFSQEENQSFKGGLQYIAEWTNSNKASVCRLLKTMTEKGLLEKTEKTIGGSNFCEYRAIDKKSTPIDNLSTPIDKKSTPIDNLSTNNIDNNIDNNIVNNTIYSEIKERWNAMAAESNIQQIKSITANRRRTIQARLNDGADIFAGIEKIKQSRFLNGENKSGWVITFDWFIKAENFQKVIEGNYNTKKNNKKQAGKKTSFDLKDFQQEAIDLALRGWDDE